MNTCQLYRLQNVNLNYANGLIKYMVGVVITKVMAKFFFLGVFNTRNFVVGNFYYAMGKLNTHDYVFYY